MAEFSNRDRKLDKLMEWIETKSCPSTTESSPHASATKDAKVQSNEDNENVKKQKGSELKQSMAHWSPSHRKSNDSKQRKLSGSIVTEIPGNSVTTYLVKDAKT